MGDKMIFKLNKKDVLASEEEGQKVSFYKLNKSNSMMKTDILESDEAYTILIDMPGFNKEEIKILTEDEYLEVYAKRIEDLNCNYLHHERYYGECYRKFYLGDGVKDKVRASYKNGVLDLYIPKTVEFKSINIEVQ